MLPLLFLLLPLFANAFHTRVNLELTPKHRDLSRIPITAEIFKDAEQKHVLDVIETEVTGTGTLKTSFNFEHSQENVSMLILIDEHFEQDQIRFNINATKGYSMKISTREYHFKITSKSAASKTSRDVGCQCDNSECRCFQIVPEMPRREKETFSANFSINAETGNLSFAFGCDGETIFAVERPLARNVCVKLGGTPPPDNVCLIFSKLQYVDNIISGHVDVGSYFENGPFFVGVKLGSFQLPFESRYLEIQYTPLFDDVSLPKF